MKNCGVAYADGCKIYLSPWVSTKGLVVNFVISEILRWRSEWHLFSLSFWGTVVTKNLIAIMRFFALLRMTFPKPPFTQGGLLDLLFCRPDCKVRSHRRGRRFPTACFEILRSAQNDINCLLFSNQKAHRRHKLCIFPPVANGRRQSRRCVSSPQQNRFACFAGDPG